MYELVRQTWEEKRIPEEWKETIIVPIHKRGNRDRCENYRGIALGNGAYKILHSNNTIHVYLWVTCCTHAHTMADLGKSKCCYLLPLNKLPIINTIILDELTVCTYLSHMVAYKQYTIHKM
jgi:hypothetical protein